MVVALTNEQRFIASCEGLGEADVRQKLNAGRFSGRRADWASVWLDQVDSGKSDATRAEEKTTRLRNATRKNGYVAPTMVAVAVLVLLIIATVLKFH